MKPHHMLITLALAIALGGCTEEPATTPAPAPPEENLLGNGEFATAGKSTTIIEYATFSPWRSDSVFNAELVGSPGVDGRPGYIRLWGNGDYYALVTQPLARPIVAGKTYIIKVAVRYRPQPNPYVDHGKVEFLALDAPIVPHVPRRGGHPQGKVIGTITTNTVTWRDYTLDEWKAGSDCQVFGILGGNHITGDDSGEFKSWVEVDDVRLIEKR